MIANNNKFIIPKTIVYLFRDYMTSKNNNKKQLNNKKSKQKNRFTSQNFKPNIPKKSQISLLNFFLVPLLIVMIYYFFQYSNVDKILITAIIALVGIAIEMFSHIFTYMLALIQSIPYIGPMFAKVIAWPIFVTLNVMAYFVSLLVIRFKGIAMVKDARILTTIFLIGLLVGFILGRLF